MATYVFSDVHGHHRTLLRLLEKVSPADEDEIWCLGDMVDRGPDGVAVMRTCREIADGRILMGNHEAMMVDAMRAPQDPVAAMSWHLNGGDTTFLGLRKLPRAERDELVDWAASLPLGAHIEVSGRTYLLVHAGLRPGVFTSHSRWNDATLDKLLLYQNPEDVLWIREDFWGRPTGFLNERGEGPIVIAGHTPVPYVEDEADFFDVPARDEDGQCQVMHLGATEATNFVADRWAIDCGAAGPAGWGRIAMVCLDTGKPTYEPVLEGD